MENTNKDVEIDVLSQLFSDWKEIFPAMLGIYYGFCGVLWLCFYATSINDKYFGFKKIQSKKYTASVMFEEVKWSFSTISIGSMFVTITVTPYRLGYSNVQLIAEKNLFYPQFNVPHQLYHNISEWGITYYLFSVIVMWLWNDAWMYWTHRFLHTPWGYSIHKLHHRFSAPSPFSTMVCDYVTIYHQTSRHFIRAKQWCNFASCLWH
jgi:sterol desaturase/sphingolipid hydroxylase (fatty acid hydroxylase superfamily)